MSKALTDIATTSRKMARSPSRFTSIWAYRSHSLADDLEMVRVLAIMHEERLKLSRMLTGLDGRSAKARDIVPQLNDMAEKIALLTKQLGERL